MFHNPEIRIHAAEKCRQFFFGRLMVSYYAVLLFYRAVKIAFGAVGYAYPVRFYDRAKLLDSFAVMLQVYFIRMQREF